MRAVYHVLIFIIVFIVAVALLFPYSKVAKLAIDSQIAKYNLPISYQGVESSLFTTRITGIEYANNVLGDVNIAYTPLSIITKSVDADVVSPFGTAKAEYSDDTVTLNASPDAGRIAALFQQNATGAPNIDLSYNTIDMKGTIHAESGAFTAQSPIGPLTLEGFTGEAAIEGKTITISQFETKGSYVVKLSGRVTIDTENIMRSPLSLSGEANIMGMNSRFNIQGTVGRPQFVLR